MKKKLDIDKKVSYVCIVHKRTNNVNNTHTLFSHTFLGFNMNTKVMQTLIEFAKIDRPKFVSFQYENKHERAQVTLLVGVTLENVYQRDLRALEQARELETDALRLQALDAVIESVKNSLSKGIGNNDAYTKQDVYEHIGPNIKRHKENGSVYVSGFVINKKVLASLEPRKQVKSSDMTIAKNSIKKRYTRMAKFREFIIDPAHFGTVAVNKNRITISTMA